MGPAAGRPTTYNLQLTTYNLQLTTYNLWDLRQVGRGPLAEASLGAAVHSLALVPGRVGGSNSSAELLVTGATDKRLRAHATDSAQLKLEGSAGVFDTVRRHRSIVDPNLGYFVALHEWERRELAAASPQLATTPQPAAPA